MKKSDFVRNVKELMSDIKEGYIGTPELIDEVWSYIESEKMRNEELWKEVKRLRKRYENKA